MGIQRKKGAVIIFLAYLIVGAPIALESIVTGTANLFYFTEVDNWIGNYLLIVFPYLLLVMQLSSCTLL